MPAIDTKYICQTFGYNGPLDMKKHGVKGEIEAERHNNVQL